MTNAQKLKVIIETVIPEISEYKSSCLADFLAEQGVTVAALPVRIGSPVWRIRAKTKTIDGKDHSTFVVSLYHYEYLKKTGAEFYVYQKPFCKSDANYLGKLCFWSKEEAEKKLAECMRE